MLLMKCLSILVIGLYVKVMFSMEFTYWSRLMWLINRFVWNFLCIFSTLSLCICAIVSLLYPFEWQHTFVTILPSNLTDVIQAPTPYILGLLSSSVSKFSEIINELYEVIYCFCSCVFWTFFTLSHFQLIADCGECMYKSQVHSCTTWVHQMHTQREEMQHGKRQQLPSFISSHEKLKAITSILL